MTTTLEEVLKVYKYDNKTRLGAMDDGGYVIAELYGQYDCYISAGIANEESFTRDFMNKYQMNQSHSFGFDGTIHSYPYQFSTNISFIKKNIGHSNDAHTSNLTHFTDRYNNIFLKIDIEGGEYPWIASLDENKLRKFKQIVIEFHGITNESFGCGIKDKLNCLEKMSKTHYIVHAHGNNNGGETNKMPNVIELTYVNKNYFPTAPPLNTTPLPIPNVDFPNDSRNNDIDLNFSPFVN
jgi:hypothetical protein